MILDDRFVPSGPHGAGSDAEPDLPSAAQLRAERLEADAPDVLLRPRARFVDEP